jgi:hypothetical protein
MEWRFAASMIQAVPSAAALSGTIGSRCSRRASSRVSAIGGAT